EIEFARSAGGHDIDNPLLQIGPRDSGHAIQRGFQTEFADLQNAFCIYLALATRLQDFLVTGPFTLLDQPRPQPPYQWVKPKDRFHQHVDRSGQVVAAAYVRQFVGEDGFQVRVVEVCRDPFRPHQNWTDYAENPRFQRSS